MSGMSGAVGDCAERRPPRAVLLKTHLAATAAVACSFASAAARSPAAAAALSASNCAWASLAVALATSARAIVSSRRRWRSSIFSEPRLCSGKGRK